SLPTRRSSDLESNFISANPHFCKSALSQFTVADTITFFESYGIRGREKTLGQLFPESNNARVIVKIFEDLCRDMGQQIICQAEVKQVNRTDSGGFRITYEKEGEMQEVSAARLVIASGGLPVAKMCATDFGLRIARQFGLKVTQTAPALVPLTITGKDAEWYAKLSGNSLYCRVSNA